MTLTSPAPAPPELAAAPSPAAPRRPRAHRPAVVAAVSTLTVLLVWELAVRLLATGSGALPAPTSILRALWEDRELWPQAVGVTAREATLGFLIATAVSVTISLVCVVFGWAERTVTRLALAIYCLPLIAMAPLLDLVLEGDQSKIALAALTAFFPVLIGSLSGLRSVPRTNLEMITVYGGSVLTEVRLVRARAALRGTISGMKVAAPAAVLGALIGELIGAERGLGVLLLASQHALQVDRTYAIAVIAAAMAGAGYLIVATLERFVGPGFEAGDDVLSAHSEGGLLRRSLVALGVGFATTVLLLGVWWVAVNASDISPILAKTPPAVWEYLVSGPQAERNQSVVFGALGTTLGHVLVGFVAGILVTFLVAAVFVLVPQTQRPLMSVAMVFQTVPTVAFVPILVLAVGRGWTTVALMGTIAVLFPSLIIVMAGLRGVSQRSLDLVTVYGASRWEVLRRVQVPAAMPAVFASLRIAVPNAFIGALMVEWLATGDGLGRLMISAGSRLDYGAIWAAVVVLTLVTAVSYTAVSVVERATLRVYAPHVLSRS